MDFVWLLGQSKKKKKKVKKSPTPSYILYIDDIIYLVSRYGLYGSSFLSHKGKKNHAFVNYNK